MKEMDDLFRSKLEDHAILPSASAWERVEAGLPGKNTYTLIWRWAAAIVVGGLMLGIFLRKPVETKTVAKTQAVPEKQAPLNKKASAPLLSEKNNNIKKQLRPTNKHLPVNKVENNSNQEMQAPVEEIITSQPEKVEIAQATIPSPAESRKRIVLTYTLEDVTAPVVAQKFDDTGIQGPTQPLVADQKEKENSFRKMFDFARTVKNSESPIGELRDMKEELFALELKKKSTSKKH